MTECAAIRVEGLSKCYRVAPSSGLGRPRYRKLSDEMVRWAGEPLRRVRSWTAGGGRPQPKTDEEFWALRDVSFEIAPGEVVGLIGRNGAGKSTLLKILARITEPTRGRAAIEGRVSSLLEVGTGFHPELTGRENIQLNGAILGMSQGELRRKFDEIVAFAEVEPFLETPVKHYSSGMYVRLAFAVAAHLEPDILVVDEVLAVGDAAFQKKCLGKMRDVAREDGRTVLYVSHQMGSVQQLCTRALLMEKGRLTFSGTVAETVALYLGHATGPASARDLSVDDAIERRGTGKIRFTRIELATLDGASAREIPFGQPLVVKLTVSASIRVEEVEIGFSFISPDGVEIMGNAAREGRLPLAPGEQVLTCLVSPMILVPGRYAIRAAIFTPHEVFDHVDEMITFDVAACAAIGGTAPPRHLVGHVYLKYDWKL